MQMLVQAKGVNFGKLASGILHRVSDGLSTDVDAMGDASLANAAKATALANAFGSKEGSDALRPVVVFVPRLVEKEGELKLARLEVRSAPRRTLPNFAQGGIYVPTAQGAAFGPSDVTMSRGPEGSRARAMADAYLPQRADTPTELARAIMSRWLRATELPGRGHERQNRRRKPQRAGEIGDDSEASQNNPFLLTRGPSSLARAVRALAFVCADLRKPRLVDAGAPQLVVEPRLWETERPRDFDQPIRGQVWRSRFVVLVLQRADEGPTSLARH